MTRIAVLADVSTYNCALSDNLPIDHGECRRRSQRHDHAVGACKDCSSPFKVEAGKRDEGRGSVSATPLYHDSLVSSSSTRSRGKKSAFKKKVAGKRAPATSSVKGLQLVELPVDRIRPFNGQPRKYFSTSKIRELVASIVEGEQYDPIKVKPITGDPDHDYELIDGERRWRAHKVAELPTIVAIVKEVSREEQIRMSFAANFCREGHTPLEKAFAAASWREAGYKTHEIARQFGVSIGWVTSHLRLVDHLDPKVQALMDPERAKIARINMQTALQLSRVQDPGLQFALANEIVKERMDSNQARRHIEKRAKSAGVTIGLRRETTKSRLHDDGRSLNRMVGRAMGNFGDWSGENIGRLQAVLDGKLTLDLRQLDSQLAKIGVALGQMHAAVRDKLKLSVVSDASS